MGVMSLLCIFLLCGGLVWNGVVVAQNTDLASLYQSTNGSEWWNNTNWLVGDPCVNGWYGITCVNNSIVEMYVEFKLENFKWILMLFEFQRFNG